MVTDILKHFIMPKKHRNHNGDICYTFAWEQGGGNHVYAYSKKGAIRLAKKVGAGTHDRHGKKYKKTYPFSVLTPQEESFRSVYLEELLEFDRHLRLAYSL